MPDRQSTLRLEREISSLNQMMIKAENATKTNSSLISSPRRYAPRYQGQEPEPYTILFADYPRQCLS